MSSAGKMIQHAIRELEKAEDAMERDQPIRVVVELDGGLISDIKTDSEVNIDVMLINRDIEGVDPETDVYLEVVGGAPGTVSMFEITYNPADVEQIWAEAYALAANADVPGMLPIEEQGCGCRPDDEDVTPEIEEDIKLEIR